MPEGDTLHRLAKKLGAAFTGAELESLELPRLAHDTSAFRGVRVERIEAVGKHLCIHFGNDRVLVTHLGMLGRWRVGPRSAPWRGRMNVVVVLRTATLEAVCTHAPSVRLLRARDLRSDPRLAALGPDLLAAGFDPKEGARRLRARGGPVGEALLDQRAVAGIGNVWKSELLFLAHLDPRAPVERIDEDVLAALLENAVALMTRAVARGGPRSSRAFVRTGESSLHVYERRGQACRVCGGPIEVIVQATRKTYLCERCQAPLPRPPES